MGIVVFTGDHIPVQVVTVIVVVMVNRQAFSHWAAEGFNERGIVKVLIGVARGKQLHDKRQTLKDADNKRRLAREMRSRSK